MCDVNLDNKSMQAGSVEWCDQIRLRGESVCAALTKAGFLKI